MTRDLNPSLAAIRRLIEEFGSVAHLARAIDVTPDDINAWAAGARPIPQKKYLEMLEAVIAFRAKSAKR
jgi:hypothetical protein